MLMVNFPIKHGDFKNSYGTVYQRVQIIFQKIWMMRLQGLDTFSQRMDSRKGLSWHGYTRKHSTREKGLPDTLWLCQT